MRKIFSLIILSVLFIQLTSFAFAQESIPTEPREREVLNQEEIQALKERREAGYFRYNLSIVATLIISLILGFFITKHRIKTNPKVSNWTIHIIIALGSVAIFIVTLADTIRCLMSPYCGFPVFYYPFVILVSLISALFSLLILKSLVKKKDISYRSNMSSSTFLIAIIFTILSPLAELITRPNYDLPAFLFLPFLTVPIMLATYSILALIGYFIDK